MKKKLLLAFLVLTISATTFAVDLDILIENAKLNSSVFQSYEITRSNTLIAKQQKDLNGVVVSVNGGLKISEDSQVISPSSVTVSVPDLIENVSLTFNAALSQINLVEKTPFTISPSVGVSKTFEINSFTDTRKTIESQKTDIQNDINYQTSLINFENGIINALISIRQTEKRVKDSQRSYDRLLVGYNNDIALGTLKEDSLSAIEQKMKLDTTAYSLKTLKESLEKAKRDFKNQYGIEYEDITSVRDVDLTFVPSEEGNSTVLIARMNLESAMQDLQAKQGFSNKLSINGNASTSVVVNKKSDLMVQLGLSAKYSADTWELSTSINDEFGKGKSMIPSVTISGSWSSSTTKTTNDELTIQKLCNTILERQNSYNSAIYTYRTNSQSLMNDIASHINDVEQLKIQTDYHKQILDHQTELYEKGLTTIQALEDARINYESDLETAFIQKMQAVVLENRIRIIEL